MRETDCVFDDLEICNTLFITLIIWLMNRGRFYLPLALCARIHNLMYLQQYYL